MQPGTPLYPPYPDPYAKDPEEMRARKMEADAGRRARRGDGRGAENAIRVSDAIRRAAGLPSHDQQTEARNAWFGGRRDA